VSDEVRVWDPAVRIFHWSLVLAFALAYVSGDEWLRVHVLSGYVIGALVAFRVLWGLVGPRYARFSSFVASPAVALEYLWLAVRFRAPRHLGHNPAGGLMIVAMLLSLAATTLTGLLVYGAGAGT
jgi:cytochrome b